jgi:hypothetical protein
MTVDACACDHDIENNTEATFASNQGALTISDVAIHQNGCLVHSDTTIMELFRTIQVCGVEKFPC